MGSSIPSNWQSGVYKYDKRNPHFLFPSRMASRIVAGLLALPSAWLGWIRDQLPFSAGSGRMGSEPVVLLSSSPRLFVPFPAAPLRSL